MNEEEKFRASSARQGFCARIKALDEGFVTPLILSTKGDGATTYTIREDPIEGVTAVKAEAETSRPVFNTAGLALFKDSLAQFVEPGQPPYFADAATKLLTVVDGFMRFNQRVAGQQGVAEAIRDITGIITICNAYSSIKTATDAHCLGSRMRLLNGISSLDNIALGLTANGNELVAKEVTAVAAGAKAYAAMCDSCPFAEYYRQINS